MMPFQERDAGGSTIFPMGQEHFLMKFDGNMMKAYKIVMEMKNNHHKPPSRKMQFSSRGKGSERSGSRYNVSWWRLNGKIVAQN